MNGQNLFLSYQNSKFCVSEKTKYHIVINVVYSFHQEHW